MSYIWHNGDKTFARYNNTVHDLGERPLIWQNYYYGVGGFDDDLFYIPEQNKIVLFKDEELIGLQVITSTTYSWAVNTDSLEKSLICRRHSDRVVWFGNDKQFTLTIEANRRYREVLLKVGYTYKMIDKFTIQWNYAQSELPSKVVITKHAKPVPQLAFKTSAKRKQTLISDEYIDYHDCT